MCGALSREMIHAGNVKERLNHHVRVLYDRLVDETPFRAEDFADAAVIAVFPRGHFKAVLIRLKLLPRCLHSRYTPCFECVLSQCKRNWMSVQLLY